MKKRTLALLLALVMSLGLMGTALAEDYDYYTVTGGTLYFDSKSGTIIGCDPGVTKADIPKEIKGVKVTSIGDRAFFGPASSTLLAVSIPSSVTSIGENAFWGCGKLETIMFSEGLNSIGENAFGNCDSLTGVAFPNSVSVIGDSAFYMCENLQCVSFPANLTGIGSTAFFNCGKLKTLFVPTGVAPLLKDIYLSSNLEEIYYGGTEAQWAASGLQDLKYYSSAVIHYNSTGIGNSSDNPAMGAAVPDFVIEDGVLVEYTGPGGDVIIPDGVIKIGEDAFAECGSLTGIRFPNSVTTIGARAFFGCDLSSVTIPGSITTIEIGAFFSCENLTKLILEDGVTKVGEGAFRFCSSLTKVEFPASIIEIGPYAFFGCNSLETVKISDMVSEIGLHAFSTHIDSPEYKAIPGLTLYSTAGGYVEAYAKTEEVPFRDISLAPSTSLALPASPTASTVLVNGQNTAFDAYNIGGANFFKLRDLAYVLSGTPKQFEVGWDGAANCITLTSGKAYTAVGNEMASAGGGEQTASPTTSKILKDGKEVSLTAYNINGANYFKLRDIGEAFDFGVDWDQATQTISIDTSKGYTAG